MREILYTVQPVRKIQPYKRYPVSVEGCAYWCNRYRRALFALRDDGRSSLVWWTFNHYTPMLFTLVETPLCQ